MMHASSQSLNSSAPDSHPLPDSGALVVDYVSPLPPVRSGIADYSVDLLEAIETLQLSDVSFQVVRVPGLEIAQDLQDRWQVRDPAEPEDQTGIPIYHVGNNIYHEAIYEMAVDRPGVVVLHDLFLHHLLQERTLAQEDVPGYVAELSRDHGWVGGAVALPPRWSGYGQSALFALPAHRSLLEAQRGVIVHSEWARRFLLEEGITRPIRVVPMVMPLPAIQEDALASKVDLDLAAAAIRRRWDISESAFVLGSFGFQTPIKRTSTAICALAQPGLEEIELVVAGEQARELDLCGLATDLGVQERVHLVGFLDGEDFAAAIRACDLSVNLRYPTAGETSASLLRVLALGRGAVVSDYAQFRDLPTDVVVRVPLGDRPGEPLGFASASTSDGPDRSVPSRDVHSKEVVQSKEVQSLAAELRRLAAARGDVDEMGRRAREFVATEHHPQLAARAFVDAVRELAAESLPAIGTAGEGSADGLGWPPVPRPSSLTWGRLESRLRVTGADDWLPGEQREIEIVIENHSFARFLAAEAGPGGVLFEVQLWEKIDQGEIDRNEKAPWLGLPRDLAPGESCSLATTLRRPLGPTRLFIEPHVAESAGFSSLGGATYSRRFD